MRKQCINCKSMMTKEFTGDTNGVYKIICMNCDCITIVDNTELYQDLEYAKVYGEDEFNTEHSYILPPTIPTIRTREDYINSLPEGSYERSFAEVGGETFRIHGHDIGYNMVVHEKAVEAAKHYARILLNAVLDKEEAIGYLNCITRESVKEILDKI